MPMEPERDRCLLTECESCRNPGDPCRFCSGTGWWRPESPRRDEDGVIGWVRVEEPCRMCASTGNEHNSV